jgi:hypothetical protein
VLEEVTVSFPDRGPVALKKGDVVNGAFADYLLAAGAAVTLTADTAPAEVATYRLEAARLLAEADRLESEAGAKSVADFKAAQTDAQTLLEADAATVAQATADEAARADEAAQAAADATALADAQAAAQATADSAGVAAAAAAAAQTEATPIFDAAVAAETPAPVPTPADVAKAKA